MNLEPQTSLNPAEAQSPGTEAQMEMPGMETPEQEDQEVLVQRLLDERNIAKGLDDDKLTEIGKNCFEAFDKDMQSRQQWEKNQDEAIKMSLLYKENKNYPWPGASNVKFPLISTAAMQFSARAYPSLVPSDGKIVKAKVVGADPQGQKALKANRIEKHMSYQIMDEMQEWEEDMDRLLITAAIVGVGFKKTYFDSKKGRNVSKFVHPKDLVVNYWATSLDDAPRVSEILIMSKRDVTTRVRDGRFLDVDLGDPSIHAFQVEEKFDKSNKLIQPQEDESTPYKIIEQHTFLDLDDDGYSEPYIVTFEYRSHKVLRITARYEAKGIKVNDKKQVTEIEPLQYYTKFPFIPAPDGSFYDIGFGLLLGAMNESVNTLINQLVDAGTLSNLQSGFLGKGLRLRMGDQKFQPGEWKYVNSTGDDLKKSIFPLPVREPSPVLFQLLQLMISAGRDLASIAEIFTGKMPGQNTPAYTTRETVEQGMKLFTAIYKRMFRALGQEFRKLYRLNAIYLEHQQEVAVLSEPISMTDYDEDTVDVIPAADPNASSDNEKMAKFQHVLQLMGLGTLDPIQVTVYGLQAAEVPQFERLLRQGPPPPSPEQQQMQMEAQLEQAQANHKMQIEEMKMKLKAATDAQKAQLEAQMGEMKLKFMAIEAGLKAQGQQQDMQAKQAMNQQNVQANAVKNQQALAHADEAHKQKMRTQQHGQNAGKGKNSGKKS